jgi:hypothetical protein
MADFSRAILIDVQEARVSADPGAFLRSVSRWWAPLPEAGWENQATAGKSSPGPPPATGILNLMSFNW